MDHEELSPLHRLMTRIQLQWEAAERAQRNPDPTVRHEAKLRLATLTEVRAMMRETLTEVALAQVDRELAARVLKAKGSQS